MVIVLPESEGKILGVRLIGKLTENDYEKLIIPKLEAVINLHGAARFLFLMDDDFHGWETAALWEYARFGFRQKDRFERIAAVGGPIRLKQWMKLKDHFVPGQIRVFAVSELEQAWDWVKK